MLIILGAVISIEYLLDKVTSVKCLVYVNISPESASFFCLSFVRCSPVCLNFRTVVVIVEMSCLDLLSSSLLLF